MKLWVILYSAKFDKTWACDSVNASQEIAKAKLTYERLKQPEWKFELVEVEIPDATRQSGKVAHDPQMDLD